MVSAADGDDAATDALVRSVAPGACEPDVPEEDLRAMLRYLLDAGVPFGRVKDALEGGDPRNALVEHRLRGQGPRFGLAEIAGRVGLPEPLVMEFLRAAGLSAEARGEADLTESELAAVELFRDAQRFFGEETVLRFTRVISSAVSRAAEAAVAVFGVGVEDPLLERGGTQLELTQQADAALGALPMVPELFGFLFRRHALDAIRRRNLASRNESSRATVTLTVGFADLVASTTWATEISHRDLADALGEFERLARLAAGDEAQVVKSIGDEVMFSAVSADVACEVATNLIDLVSRERRLPGLRVGMAHGRVVALDGDLYGPVVNLAARLVRLGDANHCVVDSGLRAEVGSKWEFVQLSPRSLAGFADPVVAFRLDRRQPEPAE